MSIERWNPNKKSMTIATPLGVPAQLRTSLRRMGHLGVLDDQMVLAVLAETFQIDPLSLCSTIRQGHLADIEGLGWDNANFLGTQLTMPVSNGAEQVGFITVSLTSNEVMVTRLAPVDNGEEIDVVEVGAAPLPAPVLFELIKHETAAERLRNLRSIFTAFVYTVRHVEGVQDLASIAQKAVDAPG